MVVLSASGFIPGGLVGEVYRNDRPCFFEASEVAVDRGQPQACLLVTRFLEHLLRRGRFKNIQVLHDELVFLGPADAQAGLTLNCIASLAHALHNLRV